MERYAKRLSVIGFILAVWVVYQMIRSLWLDWNFDRLHGFGNFQDLVGMGLSLLVILQLVGASILLRRLGDLAFPAILLGSLPPMWVLSRQSPVTR